MVFPQLLFSRNDDFSMSKGSRVSTMFPEFLMCAILISPGCIASLQINHFQIFKGGERINILHTLKNHFSCLLGL